jgi:hypothetical protein
VYLQRHLQKFANAARTRFAERDLQREQIQFLREVNNEAKVRRSTKSLVLGQARAMSYEDLQEARTKRAAKDTAKAKVKGKRGRKCKSPEPEPEPEPELEESTIGKGKRGRKRKTPEPELEEDTAGKGKYGRKRKTPEPEPYAAEPTPRLLK